MVLPSTVDRFHIHIISKKDLKRMYKYEFLHYNGGGIGDYEEYINLKTFTFYFC